MSDCRLLILDDDPMIGLTIQVIAESAGAQAQLATEPETFFSLVASWDPTHLCIDLNMPAMDGLHVLTELAQRGCSAQVIVSSGVGQRVLDAAGRSGSEQGLAVLGVLPKPFTPAALRALLQRSPAVPRSASPAGGRSHWQPDLPALRHALQRGELSVVYQPNVDCHSGLPRGVEALVRWHHPQHGVIAPDRFIELAEQGGLIDELTVQVLGMALDWFVPWCAAAPERAGLRLSVNLSGACVGSPEFVLLLRERCTQAGMDPQRLIFELTETATMGDAVRSLELLTRLRMQGFELSIDDFGIGYSSLRQLVRLPFSEMKIDREFVMSAMQSAESQAVIRSIVDLGHNLGLRVVAEGVEDAGALAYLRSVGCDLAQGYLIARPMPAAALQAWWPGGDQAAANVLT